MFVNTQHNEKLKYHVCVHFRIHLNFTHSHAHTYILRYRHIYIYGAYAARSWKPNEKLLQRCWRPPTIVKRILFMRIAYKSSMMNYTGPSTKYRIHMNGRLSNRDRTQYRNTWISRFPYCSFIALSFTLPIFRFLSVYAWFDS